MFVNRLFVVGRHFGREHLEIKTFLGFVFSHNMNDELSIDLRKTLKNLL